MLGASSMSVTANPIKCTSRTSKKIAHHNFDLNFSRLV